VYSLVLIHGPPDAGNNEAGKGQILSCHRCMFLDKAPSFRNVNFDQPVDGMFSRPNLKRFKHVLPIDWKWNCLVRLFVL
jgi:hypothetical protein